MQKKVVDDFKYYLIDIVIENNDKISNIIANVEGFINSTRSENFYFTPTLNLYVDGDSEYKGTHISHLSSSLYDIGDISDYDNVTIKAIIEKPLDKLYVFDADAFISNISKFKTEDQIKLISTNFIGSEIVTRNNIFKNDTYQTYQEEINLVKSINTLIKDNNSILQSPCYYSYLAENIKDNLTIYNYLISIRTKVCLMLLADHYTTENKDYTFYVSKDKYITYSDIENNNTNNTFSKIIYSVFKWVFEDDSYNIKKSIFNSVISMQADIPSSLNLNLLHILNSNLKIIYKENFNSYIDAKNGILNYLFDLSNKIQEQISSKISSSNTVFLIVMSFFFSSIVLTTIDKGKFENIFTFQVAILSSIFIIGAMFYMLYNQKNFENSIKFQLKQKDEFKSRYNNIFSHNELDNLFEPESIKTLISESTSRQMYYVYQCILLAIFCIIWFLYKLNS
ncbi:hypothetical protein GLP21_03045 [Photobacterium carnosum]|uniref:hypothetical protein n=1 Tax=Photobacterium carnosum TaxID=2023717 RepID=UPI001E360232|nr:hypothetical protein [Photobacterium carnosum]MCD9547648.1 hypothetical protein [Photobacterium carnosum]MCF2305487.1 hypothetical protein [Photobacterium carnosum]